MKHAVAGYKLGRDTEHRRAMFRNLAAALFQHGQITTTIQKAKAVQPFVERLITLARKGDLAARRRAIALLQDRYLVTADKETGDPVYEQRSDGGDKKLIQKLFAEIGPQYRDRAGGYTRIIQLAGAHRINRSSQGLDVSISGYRLGDGGDLVVLQLVEEAESGPNVRGRASRRRQKQDRRAAFAAQRRRGDKEEKAEAPAEAEEPVTEAAEDAAPVEQPTTEAGEESTEESKD